MKVGRDNKTMEGLARRLCFPVLRSSSLWLKEVWQPIQGQQILVYLEDRCTDKGGGLGREKQCVLVK